MYAYVCPYTYTYMHTPLGTVIDSHEGIAESYADVAG